MGISTAEMAHRFDVSQKIPYLAFN